MFDGGRYGLNLSRCQTCNVEYHFHYLEQDKIRMFRYKIFASYKGKVFSIGIYTEHDSAQVYQHPDDPDGTWIMVATLQGANIKEKINPNNFLEKLPFLLTFS